VRVCTEQYRAGAVLITELMAANADLARAQLDLVSAAIDARIAHSQLVRAIGADGPYDVAR
jgi:outer membrane protein TolC